MLELIERLTPAEDGGAAAGKSRGPAAGGGAGRSLSGAAARDVVSERGRRTLRRDQLAGAPRAARAGLARGRRGSTRHAFHDLLRTDADAAVALLADLGAATDPQLRVAGPAARGAAVRARGRLGAEHRAAATGG